MNFYDRHKKALDLDCACRDVSHLVRLSYWTDESPDYMNLYLHYYLEAPNFFKRLWYGIRYIFGYRCRYGEFGEVLLEEIDALRLRTFLNGYVKDMVAAKGKETQ
jgi:hypothetical protein